MLQGTQLVSPLLWDHYAILLLLPVAWLMERGHWWAIALPIATSLPLLGLVPPAIYPLEFAICLLALMVSYDDRGVLRTSLEGGRTRSYFGIYEVYNRADGSARVLTHGTTLHGIQNLDPALQRVPRTGHLSAG